MSARRGGAQSSRRPLMQEPVFWRAAGVGREPLQPTRSHALNTSVHFILSLQHDCVNWFLTRFAAWKCHISATKRVFDKIKKKESCFALKTCCFFFFFRRLMKKTLQTLLRMWQQITNEDFCVKGWWTFNELVWAALGKRCRGSAATVNSEGFELLQGSRLSAPQRMKGKPAAGRKNPAQSRMHQYKKNSRVKQKKKITPQKLLCGKCHFPEIVLLEFAESSWTYNRFPLSFSWCHLQSDCIVVVFLIIWLLLNILQSKVRVCTLRFGSLFGSDFIPKCCFSFFFHSLEWNLIDLNIGSQTTVYDHGQLADS